MIEETPPKRLVLDANILLRAMLGSRVQRLIEGYKDSAAFYSPDICFEDARKYIGKIAAARGFDTDPGLAILTQLTQGIQAIEISSYARYEETARLRIVSRDPGD